MKAKFKVRQDLAFWASGGMQYYPGSEHEVSGSKAEMAAIEAAGAAGSLYDVSFDGDAPNIVESDKDSLKKLAVAMGAVGDDGRYTGPWMEGHLDQHERDKAQGGNIEVGGDT
jgi:hypothetical protein